ncbi:Gfo/Idh/MocA family protein [Robertkochia sediminum]|uniref:Gfo/Idh/MocA family protein n=1 Tax=Robertkochia sediminum TaxID=2785326 RepID=UPI001932B08D|nr:Gfo/Idh/MocA family oxidoreductase [Robertkochia sediminum]MBL7473812.1 Gfo/Idh/MocA family oxidoreductase [Robertkochia sediminum]
MKRRSFIKNVARGSAALYIVPAHVLGGRHVAPSDTLYVGCFGVGGRGGQVIRQLRKSRKVKFVAFCDVDAKRAAETFKAYPDVATYTNFREVYDKHLNDIDGIMVATADHTHAAISLPFMKAGKHAYVEKPLTHNISEARLMADVARDQQLITQMGNQGSSGDGIRTLTEWMESGVIGKVHRVDCWTNRPVWPQGVFGQPAAEEVPDTLNWDQWLGPAANRPYSSAYLPFKWRGWWDFGTGALGDMGCHILESPFKSLKLGYPLAAEASCTTVWEDDFVESKHTNGCPPSSVVRLQFRTEAQGNIDVNWYDGGIMPEIPEGLQEGETLGSGGGGSIFYGERGIVVCDTYSANPRVLNIYRSQVGDLPKPYLKRQKENHVDNWVNAILSKGETSSPFSYAGPLTETVLMGNLAIKAFQYRDSGNKNNVYPGRRKLLWDGKQMKILNFDKANDWVQGSYRDGWGLG